MAEESDLEKTEPASPKRIEKARAEGNVPRSRELATCTVLLAAGLGLWALGDNLGTALKQNFTSSLSFDRHAAFDPFYLLMKIADSIYPLLIAFAPLAIIVLAIAVASPALIGGWVISNQAFSPKFNRLNPIQGLGNIISRNAVLELIKAIAKTLLVSLVAYGVISSDIDGILSLSLQPIHSGIGHVQDMLLKGFLLIVGALVAIAAIDVPYQLKQYADKLKMSKEEVRREAKEADGNPEIKSRIRQQQREMAKRRMMSEIPNADVVITNPTHYAVAIKYKEDGMRAPIVVAKGADAIALKIREIASDNNVLTVEAPKLARALYAHTDLGDEIPQALYSAMAEVLAYVFQIRLYKRLGGFCPELPNALDVPETMDPHSLLATLHTQTPEAMPS